MAKKKQGLPQSPQTSRSTSESDWVETLLQRPALLRSILIGAVVVAYLTSFSGGFVFDDHPHIVENQSLGDVSAALRSMTAISTRPITRLTLALNVATFGKHPWSFHIVNLAIHLVSVVVLFGLVRGSVVLLNKQKPTGLEPNLVGFIAAILWGLHPLGTMAVTYIIQRHESLMAMFYLLVLYCLVRARMADRSWPWYLAGIFSCWLGMGAKEVMVTAPIAAVLFDRIILSDNWRSLYRSRGWVYAVMMSPAVLLLVKVIPILLKDSSSQAGVLGTYETASPWLYLWTQSGVILHYVRLAVCPDYLTFDYDWPVASNVWEYLPSALAVVTLLGGSLWYLWRGNPLGLVAFLFFLILAPTSSVVPIIDVAFEHRMYLPLACLSTLAAVGMCYAIAWWKASESIARRHSLVLLLTVGLSLGLGLRTLQRNLDYRDEIALWTSVVESRPMNLRANHNLVNHLRAEGRSAEAEVLLKQSIGWCQQHGYETFPLEADLAELYVYEGAADLALRQFQVAVDSANTQSKKLSPYRQQVRDRQQAELHTSFGALLDMVGRPKDAAVQFDLAIAFRPDVPHWYALAGDAHRKSGNVDLALQRWKHAVDADKSMFQVARDYGMLLAGVGRYDEAVPYLESSVRKNRDDVAAAYQLIRIQAAAPSDELRQPEVALTSSLNLQKQFPQHQQELREVEAMALSQLGRFDEANSILQSLILEASNNDSATRERLQQQLAIVQQQQPIRLARKSPVSTASR